MFCFKRKLFYSKMFQDQLENLHDRLKTDTFTYLDFRTTLEGIRFVSHRKWVLVQIEVEIRVVSHPNFLLSLL